VVEVIASNSLNNARVSQFVVETIVPHNSAGEYEYFNTLDSTNTIGSIFHRSLQDNINYFTDSVFSSGGLIKIPPLVNVELISINGINSYADYQLNNYFVFYDDFSSNGISVNYSPNQTGWTLNSSNAINKEHTADCTFNMAFDIFGNYFDMVWQETTPAGILNIKYSDFPIVSNGSIDNNPGNNNLFFSGSNGILEPVPALFPLNNSAVMIQNGSSPIFVYPNLSVENNFGTENIPFDEISIKDASGMSFNINSYLLENPNIGVGLSLPYSAQSASFVQEFRQPNSQINIFLTTVDTATEISLPLQNYPINIYQGTSQNIYQRIFTGIDGKVSIVLQPGQYTFEYDLLETSINFQQIIL
jgi:hypothetical protein